MNDRQAAERNQITGRAANGDDRNVMGNEMGGGNKGMGAATGTTGGTGMRK